MTTIIGVFSLHTNAEHAINELRAFGVPEDDISYVYANKEGEVIDGQHGDEAGEGAAEGATTGAVVGAIAGLAVANGILPGLGSLFVAGPLAAALGLTGVAATTVAGAVTGAAAGGLIGALVGLGVSEDDAEMYEGIVRRGDILVIIRSASPDAKDVFARTGAREIREYRT